MRSAPKSSQFPLVIMLAAALWGGCSASGTSGAQGGSSPSTAGSGVMGVAGVAASSGGALGAAGTYAMVGGGGAAQAGTVGVAPGGSGGGVASGGAPAGGAPAGGAPAGGAASGGSNAQGGAGGANNAGAGGKGAAGAASAGAAGANNCNLPPVVSFQKDIQGFLTTSCGKGVSSGCHVTDTSKTNLGFDHAYDWITAVAHPGSCPASGPPYPTRFGVVMAVLQAANPPSCTKSRIMPPAGMGTPLTTCQKAALQAWLDETQVSQMHVVESDDTKALYPAGPYLMPPFN